MRVDEKVYYFIHTIKTRHFIYMIKTSLEYFYSDKRKGPLNFVNIERSSSLHSFWLGQNLSTTHHSKKPPNCFHRTLKIYLSRLLLNNLYVSFVYC